MKTINPDRVEELLIDCLFNDDELVGAEGDPMEERLPEKHVYVEGILNPFAFHPERLESHRDEVRAMLDLLPMTFRVPEEGGNGGWTFLNACIDRNDVQWTGFHLRMDQLFSLGQGLGYVKQVLPRALWSSLPGGMPYYSIDLRDQ